MIDFKDTSTVYQYYKSELEQIQKHKWIESEKADIFAGFSFALTDWIRYHRKAWRKSIKKPHQ